MTNAKSYARADSDTKWFEMEGSLVTISDKKVTLEPFSVFLY
jgi:hypothetical protein